MCVGSVCLGPDDPLSGSLWRQGSAGESEGQELSAFRAVHRRGLGRAGDLLLVFRLAGNSGDSEGEGGDLEGEMSHTGQYCLCHK